MNFDFVLGLKALPFFSRKERKGRKEMEGGNEVSEANGITQFANGEPKRLKRT